METLLFDRRCIGGMAQLRVMDGLPSMVGCLVTVTFIADGPIRPSKPHISKKISRGFGNTGIA